MVLGKPDAERAVSSYRDERLPRRFPVGQLRGRPPPLRRLTKVLTAHLKLWYLYHSRRVHWGSSNETRGILECARPES